MLLSTQVYKWVPAKLMVDYRAIQGKRNSPSRFMLRKPEKSMGLMGRFARIQTLLCLTEITYIMHRFAL